ncbi:MAG TPA: tripartite tricarboxylate transporter TctB family protein [Casimicrobiaceae bacterium]|nr:tripartite tricarboxylate transporter TctB family protein [Casimicrobiaceae bacterium]
MDAQPGDVRAKGDVETRWVELVVALLVVIGGLVVIQDSLRVGIRWEAEGPRAGYFPFYIGVILAIAGGTVAAGTLMRWKSLAGRVFVTRTQLGTVMQMLVPSIIYVIVLAYIGIYVASAIFIAAFMVWQGKYRWWVATLIAIAICVGLFFMFEVWFLVPLPKGPLESWLGY